MVLLLFLVELNDVKANKMPGQVPSKERPAVNGYQIGCTERSQGFGRRNLKSE